ncbi:hypothetical protein [uncultured Treponema sp.]|uniref:hypothetical protein n=1 Tax=uncultured Treponema sp. TaxID=162155 RepID=UPI00259579B2|nr:hypothetical protein [uncultured Treponema sp.]
MATASASDQTLRVWFRAFYKMRSPFQSLTQEIPTSSAAFLPSVSAKRQSEIPSKTKAKSSKKELRFPYLLQLASTIQFLKRHSVNQSA